jgi:deoxyribodipyrimidine photo-lyase
VRVLVWFHRDFRTHDHEGLHWALSQGFEVEGVAFLPASGSAAKLKFWHETADNLSINLKLMGVPLSILAEDPSKAIPKIIASRGIDKVITHCRMNQRDQKQLEILESLIHVPLLEMGDVTLFSKNISQELSLEKLKPFTKFKNYAVSTFTVPQAQARFEEMEISASTGEHWSAGGEASGLRRLKDYVWKSRACLHYHETRNGMILRDDSSKFSRWLSLGALSPRLIYQELKELEKEVGPSPGIDALIYELYWRDYFKFLAHVLKQDLFSRQGLRTTAICFEDNADLLSAWCKGETGEDFVDANMRELLLTGWMSNRGRQNVASFFAKQLNLDWTQGARWFEDQLIDEDPENNWGNWQYLSGAGTDPRDRKFDIKRQAGIYDSQNHYQNHWLEKTKGLEDLILQKLKERSKESTICPSEILADQDKQNKQKMEEVRSAARRLFRKDQIDFFQKGEIVNPQTAKGPIRLKLR